MYENNRVNDRKQSLEIQKQLVGAQEKLAEEIKGISIKIDENQKKTDERFALSEKKANERIRAELKDKIMSGGIGTKWRRKPLRI